MAANTFDIESQAYKRDPYPTLARMIAAGPVVPFQYPLIGKLKLVTGYDAVCELLRDRQTFVRDPRTAGLRRGSNLPWWFPNFLRTLAESMINRDEPDHRRLRSLVEQAFLRRSIGQMRPRLENIADGMLDELDSQQRRDHQPVDLVAGLARPFPLAVICELLGLPQADRPRFVRMAENFSSMRTLGTVFRMLNGIRQTTAYIREQIRACRQSPREGLITALIEAETEGQRFSEEEMVAMVVLLLFAGHVTTVHLISAGIFTLLRHSDQKRELLGDWSLNHAAVHEVLRYISPVQLTKPMLPVRDLNWHGTPLRRGERIVAFLASANADPAKFREPARFDIHRDPNPHVAFGTGIHVCLGLSLAVAEAEIAFARLFQRFPSLELAIPEADVRWSSQTGTRGVETLPVMLQRAA